MMHLQTEKMLKIQKLLIFILLILPFNAFALEGKLKCTVKDQQIFQITEGQPKRYSGFTDDLKIGDTFVFRYGLENDQIFYVKSVDTEFGSLFYKAFVFDVNTAINVITSDTLIHSSSLNELRFLSTQISIDKDGFQFGYVFSEGGLRMERYYKSDWMGGFNNMVKNDNAISSEFFAIDCKHITKSVWSEIYERLSSQLRAK